ncbi:Tm-1-like ATP-binding domain-containing protein [Paraburkholderia sp. CNPSo 3272]|uniref:Tm-1-like ATP-binding domain-containing protein n=1 Tax=Paraburkholderia sp. CNPSo 3272 TaxID=2940931 RepID=UPI0020B83C9F|nr:Tm-1-like ATP-binding domain-containing protein [Paraburkholderia sp. CNPSo 3272]MCP3727102.1 Tm-1-like ATP-binding domain-containing protein [Paraburkholderia sp. CNPSo 3272]
MTQQLSILLIGTADTKADELLFMKDCIERQGSRAIVMDVGVLGQAPFEPQISNSDVAQAAGKTLEEIAACGDENEAMAAMAEGAVNIAIERYRSNQIHGVLALGGTMGTDLALDVTAALPLGLPKFVVSTVAYSHLIPPERLAPDLMMILWAGGLYGLNDVCKAVLSQASGAILGACRTVEPSRADRPKVAIGSLGKSCLSYMVRLTAELEERGYEPVVFHCTGMGGRAMEALIAQKQFVAVFDFALCELGNEVHGSVVTAGPSRLEAAGRLGIPQLVSPGASDMIDVQTWKPLPKVYEDRLYHAHNRLIASVTMTPQERRAAARVLADKVNKAAGPTAFLLPTWGIQQWDRVGQPLHDPDGLQAFLEEVRSAVKPPVNFIELDCHINDDFFVDGALQVFDRWVSEGKIAAGVRSAKHAEV